jgi:hypothetical protein
MNLDVIVESLFDDPRPRCDRMVEREGRSVVCRATKLLVVDEPIGADDTSSHAPVRRCPACEVHLVRVDPLVPPHKEARWFSVARDPGNEFWAWAPEGLRSISARFGFGANARTPRRAIVVVDGDVWLYDGELAICTGAYDPRDLLVALGFDAAHNNVPIEALIAELVTTSPAAPDAPHIQTPVQIKSAAPTFHPMMSKGRKGVVRAGQTVAYSVGPVRVAPEPVQFVREVFGPQVVWHAWRDVAVARLGSRHVALVRSVDRAGRPAFDALDEAMGDDLP